MVLRIRDLRWGEGKKDRRQEEEEQAKEEDRHRHGGHGGHGGGGGGDGGYDREQETCPSEVITCGYHGDHTPCCALSHTPQPHTHTPASSPHRDLYAFNTTTTASRFARYPNNWISLTRTRRPRANHGYSALAPFPPNTGFPDVHGPHDGGRPCERTARRAGCDHVCGDILFRGLEDVHNGMFSTPRPPLISTSFSISPCRLAPLVHRAAPSSPAPPAIPARTTRRPTRTTGISGARG